MWAGVGGSNPLVPTKDRNLRLEAGAAPLKRRFPRPPPPADLVAYGCMVKAAPRVVIFMLVSSFAFAGSPCPLALLSGTDDASSFAITFQNVGKLPIRQLEFSCAPVRQHAHGDQNTSCRERNALFFPGMEYTVSYPYPRGRPERIVVSLRSATLSNGYVWKPSQHQLCRALRIDPRKR